MKRLLKIIISMLVTIILIFILQNKVQAKSYYIENMNIKATVLQNGDVEVEQTLEYSFDGSYNGIYITIPTQYKNNEKIISKIKDDIYNVENVELQSVKLVEDEKENQYNKAYAAYNGADGVYTEENNNDIYKLKVYSPSYNENKTFKLNYILKNLCAKHNDIGELYYNFIGGEWQCTIKYLTIDIMIPNNTQELKIWGHGPDNGSSEIIDNTHVRLKVENVATGKYVAARVVFDKSNIPNAPKNSNLNAYNLIYEDEQQIAKISDAKKEYTRIVYIISIILIIYWIILLLKYEKDKKNSYVDINEEELFEKYNPMLAGCLQGSRDILARDIIAVILNLIDKKCIELEIKGNLEGKDDYRYWVKKVPEATKNMDEIEKYVYEWLFGKNTRIVELTDALKTMPQNKQANEKFKKLNRMVQSNLNEKGANNQSVPKLLRIFNTVLFIISIFIVISHIQYEGFEIYSGNDILFRTIVVTVIGILPLALLILYIPLLLIVTIRQKITGLIHKITGQRVVTTTVTIILIFLVIIGLTILFSNSGNRYLIADEILICIALIIMLTDNLMLKNNINMMEDYSRMNGLKDKIENYSMMEDRDIEQITIWEKYLAYAVSFGMTNKISKRIKQLPLNDDMLIFALLKNDKMMNYITSDYYFFYKTASLDRKFVKNYQKIATNIMITSTSDSSGGGDGGGFSGGGGFSRGRWPRWRWRSFLTENITDNTK